MLITQGQDFEVLYRIVPIYLYGTTLDEALG